MKWCPSKAKSFRFRSTEKAFTFAEVLAAMVFMAILIPVVMQGLSLANRASVFAERKRMAAFLANGKLNEIVSTESWSFSSNRGDFSPEYSMYQWELLQPGWEQDNMQELTCVVTFQVQGRDYQIQLSTLVEDSL